MTDAPQQCTAGVTTGISNELHDAASVETGMHLTFRVFHSMLHCERELHSLFELRTLANRREASGGGAKLAGPSRKSELCHTVSATCNGGIYVGFDDVAEDPLEVDSGTAAYGN